MALILLAVSGLLCAVFLSLVFVFKNLNSAYALFQSQQRQKRSLFDFVTGHYLAPQSCALEWQWKDNHIVGHTLHFNVKVSWKTENFSMISPSFEKNVVCCFCTTEQ
jgi:hypothetical protein